MTKIIRLSNKNTLLIDKVKELFTKVKFSEPDMDENRVITIALHNLIFDIKEYENIKD